MIEKFRKSVNTTVAKVLLGLLAIAFVFLWGGQDGLRMIGVGKSNTVAKVGSEKITIQDLNLQIARAVSMIQIQSGQKLSPQEVRSFGIDRQVLETLVQQKLLDLEIQELKMDVTDNFLASEIRKDSFFQTDDKAFSKQLFLTRIQQLGYRNERDYVRAKKNEILRSRILSALSGAVDIPLSAIEPLYKWDNQIRYGTGLVIDHTKMIVSTPTEDELRDFFGTKRTHFKVPEQRSFTAILIDSNRFKKEAKNAVSQDDVLSIYEIEKNRRFDNMKRSDALKNIRRELEDSYTRDRALEVGRKIDDGFLGGESLENVIKSLDDNSGIRLVNIDHASFINDRSGAHSASKMSTTKRAYAASTSSQINQKTLDALVQIAFQTEIDLLSPLESLPSNEVGLVLVTGIDEPRHQTFQEAKEEVRDHYKETQQIQAAKNLVQEINDRVKSGEALRVIAADKKLKVISIKANRQGAISPTPYKMTPTALENFFSVSKNNLSLIPVNNQSGNRIQILALLDKVSLPTKIVDEKKDQFKSMLKNDYSADILEIYLKYLQDKFSVDINEEFFQS